VDWVLLTSPSLVLDVLGLRETAVPVGYVDAQESLRTWLCWDLWYLNIFMALGNFPRSPSRHTRAEAGTTPLVCIFCTPRLSPHLLSPSRHAGAGLDTQSLACLLPVRWGAAHPLSAVSAETGLEDTSRAGWQASLVAPWTAWDRGRGPTCLVLRSDLGPASSSEDWSRDSARPHLRGIYPPTLTYFCCFKLRADVLTSPVIEGTQHLLQQQSN